MVLSYHFDGLEFGGQQGRNEERGGVMRFRADGYAMGAQRTRTGANATCPQGAAGIKYAWTYLLEGGIYLQFFVFTGGLVLYLVSRAQFAFA